MPGVIFSGPVGRLEGRYYASKQERAPIALILSPHPKAGGHMDHRVSVALFKIFKERKFSVLAFNYRGTGRSQGQYDQGAGELADAAAALDWVQSFNPNAPFCWTTGYSFGAWIAMQLLMRRPEIRGFISISPPVNTYDFSFLAPCPSSGIVLYGTEDKIVPAEEIEKFVPRIRTQKGRHVSHKSVAYADHFYRESFLDDLVKNASEYIDDRIISDQPV